MNVFEICLDGVDFNCLSDDSQFAVTNGGEQQIINMIKDGLTNHITQLTTMLRSINASRLIISPTTQLHFDVPSEGVESVNLTDLQEVGDKIAKIIHPHIHTFWAAIDSLVEEVYEITIDSTGKCTVLGDYSIPESFKNRTVIIRLGPKYFHVTDITEKQRLELRGELDDFPELYEPLLDKYRIFRKLPDWIELTWASTDGQFVVQFNPKRDDLQTHTFTEEE